MELDIGLNKFKGANQISGTIPEGIKNLIGLTWLVISMNSITGEIPVGIGKLERLEDLRHWEHYGSVYKGVLGSDGLTVAVKVLNLTEKGATKSFVEECNALRGIRHQNLIKIITTCSSIDSKGDDFKAIVFEFMPNGSLEEWLHQSEDEQDHQRSLSLTQRLRTAMEVASALQYLHHHCQEALIHGNLKPSNILMDHDMIARMGDFGVAHLLSDHSLPIKAYPLVLKIKSVQLG
ncbi:unnamed protein product [Camellia sinensis]